MSTHVVSPVEFDSTEIEISGNAYQHLFRARRLRIGDELRVVDGEGRARRGVIARVDRQRAVVALGSAVAPREPAVSIELLVAPPKPDRAAWLVEKATELGVSAVHFIATERTARDSRSFAGGQILRLHRVAIAAVEQCGRSVVPGISALEPLAARIERELADGVRPLVLDLGEGLERDPLAQLNGLAAPPRFSIAVGPEGGWSDAERELFERLGLPRWSLGARVLRVETAAVAATAVLAARVAWVSSVDTPPPGA